MAQYGILVPREDNLGQPLIDLSYYAQQSIVARKIADGSYIEPGKRGYWRQAEAPEEHDMLIVIADDNPMVESHIKQIAAEVGELTNQWGILVTKTGGGHFKNWTIKNPHYLKGQGADKRVIARGN